MKVYLCLKLSHVVGARERIEKQFNDSDMIRDRCDYVVLFLLHVAQVA